MNVGELKRLLEDMDDEAEVRIASQPAWPFEYHVNDVMEAGRDATGAITTPDDTTSSPKSHRSSRKKFTQGLCVDEDADEVYERFSDDEDEAYEEVEETGVVYLVEGDQIGYLPSIVAQMIGWD